MNELAYDYKTISEEIKESSIDIESYKYNQRMLFGNNSKLSTFDKGILMGYTIAMDSKRDTYLRKEMFIMADTSINNTMILNKIDELGDKLSNKIDEKVDKLDIKLNDKIDKLDNKLSNKIDKLDDKTNDINSKISAINVDVDYIKNDINKLKENTSNLSVIEDNVNKLMNRSNWWKQYLLAPIIASTIVGIILLVAKKFFE